MNYTASEIGCKNTNILRAMRDYAIARTASGLDADLVLSIEIHGEYLRIEFVNNGRHTDEDRAEFSGNVLGFRDGQKAALEKALL